MGTINPRARGDASLGGRLRAGQDDRQQIRRLLTTTPKPAPVAPPSAGGGIVGMAEVRAAAGSVNMGAGESRMDYQSVIYDTPSDPFAGSAGASSPSWVTVNGYRLTLTPGWYILTASFRLGWSTQGSAPSSLATYMQGGWNAAHNDLSYFALADIGTSGFPAWGIQQVVSSGPTFINAGDDVWFECRPSTSPPASSTAGTLVWNIAKFG